MSKSVALSLFNLTGFEAVHDEATDTRVLLAWRGDGDENGDGEAGADADGTAAGLSSSSATSGSDAESSDDGAPASQQQPRPQQPQQFSEKQQHQPPLLVISFRGTASRANAVSDLKLWRTAVKPRRYFGGALVQVHAGGCSRRGTACVLLQLF